MILDFAVSALVLFAKTVLGILPNVPATPSAVTSGATWLTDTIASVVTVFRMVLSNELLVACMIVIAGAYSFEWIYHTVMWIVRKIPMINMK